MVRTEVLTGGFHVHYQLTISMTTYKTYAQFNSFSAQGRVFNAEVVNGANGAFLAVTVITNLKDGDDGVTVTFNTSNGLMSLYNQGYLPNGRIITVTGHVDGVSETYTNKEGVLTMRQRPQVHLTQAQAHVGPMPQGADAPKARKNAVVRPSDAKRTADEMLEDVKAPYSEIDEAAAAAL